MKRYAWADDPAGNRTTEQVDDVPLGATYNARNQLMSRQPGGALLFRGSVNEPAIVTPDFDAEDVQAHQLAENVWDTDKGCAVAKVVHNFGRAEQLDAEALRRLASSVLRVFSVSLRQ